MSEIKIGTVTDGDGLVIEIWASETDGNTTFRLEVVEGCADLRGFFFDYNGGLITVGEGAVARDQEGTQLDVAITAEDMGSSGDSDITKVGSSDNNLNGTKEKFDAGLEFGTSGIGKDDIGSVTFTIEGLTLANIDTMTFGIRATSVGDTWDDRSDSVKLIGEFEVPPSVVSVEVSDTLIADADAGGTFEVTVTFDQSMDTTVDPTLTFSPSVAGTLSFSSGSWTDASTKTATYNVFDANVDIDAVMIDVAGAQDASGTPQLDYLPEVEFDIDTENPTLTVAIAADALNDTTNSSTATFEFSENVSGFEESDVAVSGGTLSGFTQVDGNSYTALFTATDGIDTTGSVSVAAGSYTDVAGNDGGAGSDTVDIDTFEGFLGKQLTYQYLYPTRFNPYGSSTSFTVGSGIEVPSRLGPYYAWGFNVDVFDDRIEVTFTGNIYFSDYGWFNGFRITDAFNNVRGITGVWDTSIKADTFRDFNNIYVEWGGKRFFAGETFTIYVSFANTGNDPIVLDLSGDQFAFVSDGQAVNFDLNADGEAELVSWVNSSDGLLTMDLDGSGVIENGTEVISESFSGSSFATSLEALRSLDSNFDGVVDKNDSAFSELLVWRDLNGDGVTQEGELLSLDDLEIIEISVQGEMRNDIIDGQEVLAGGTFVYADGAVNDYVGVNLSPPNSLIESIGDDEMFLFAAPDANLLEGTIGADDLIGSDAEDVIRGAAGDDVVIGGNGSDILDGGPGNDSLGGDSGNDLLFGGPGNDIIQGGSGTDMAGFEGTYDDYDVVDSNGYLTVTEVATGDSDFVSGVEYLQFDDVTVNVNAFA